MTTKYDAIIQNFVRYTTTCEDLRAAVIIGSRARRETPADEFSDLDILILSNDPDKHIENTNWLSEIGEVHITFVEPLPLGNGKERRVMFSDALDVDFAIVPASQAEVMFFSPEIISVFRKGFKMLFDKDDLFSHLDLSSDEEAQTKKNLPSETDVQNTIQDFWYHCIWSMKKIQRGELWTAKMCVDGYMKWLMLKMIEWDYQLNQTKPEELWHNGRFFEKWVDQAIQNEMKGCFSHYERDDIIRALKCSMELFSRLSKKVTQKLDIQYPQKAEDFVREYQFSML
ncbi:MAG: aminoglycoside 6-adenylyltransferase [Thermotogota bacterium]